MNTQLKQIADHYLLRGLFCQEIGLWNGKTGMAIFFFLLSRQTQNRWYEEFAGELLDDVCNNLSRHCPITFADGLCGIGWAIEFLKKEGFIEGDTDEILEEVDKQVMERDVRRITDTSLETGLAGIVAYVRSRLESERVSANFQPFDSEFLNDLETSCLKNGILWKAPKYHLKTIWKETIRHEIYYLKSVEKCISIHNSQKTFNSQKQEKKQLLLFTRNNCAFRYGIGTYIKQLTTSLDLSIWDVHVIELYATSSECFMNLENGIYYVYLPNTIKNRSDKDKTYQKSIFYWISTNYTSDKLHCHFNFTTERELITLLKDKLNIQIVFTLHYMEWKFYLNGKDERNLQQILSFPQSPEEKKLLSCFLKEKDFITRYCDRIIAVSQHSYDTLKNIYAIDISRITYIPHGLCDTYRTRNKQELEYIRKKYHISEQDRIVLYVGRLTEDKGLHILIKAFKILLEEHNNIHLVIAGGGDYGHFMKTTNPLWNKIIFTGYLSKEQLNELYAISTIGVIPSSHEEFGYVAIEMFMHRLPVICSDASGLKEVSDNGKCAIMIENWCSSNKEMTLKNVLTKILSDTLYQEELKKKGRNRYMKEYSQAVYQKKIGLFYK